MLFDDVCAGILYVSQSKLKCFSEEVQVAKVEDEAVVGVMVEVACMKMYEDSRYMD